MAVESANYQCPSCGGVLRYFTGTGELRCDYCDSSFTVAEVEAAFAPRLERADSRMTDTLPPTGPTHDVAPMRTYTCASCAAELVCDATTAITECPYCGNQAVVPGPSDRRLFLAEPSYRRARTLSGGRPSPEWFKSVSPSN